MIFRSCLTGKDVERDYESSYESSMMEIMKPSIKATQIKRVVEDAEIIEITDDDAEVKLLTNKKE